jgi:hypothetical protein
MKPKQLNVGRMYVVPWELLGYVGCELSTAKNTTIPAHSYVVVLGVDEVGRELRIKLLSPDGEVVFVRPSVWALDYWKEPT